MNGTMQACSAYARTWSIGEARALNRIYGQ